MSSSAAPPEGRIHNFPQRSRFRAPHIRFTTTDEELYNRVDCSNAKVELDIDWAREVRKQGQVGQNGIHRIVNGDGDFRLLFGGEVENGEDEKDVVEKYFPKSRRYEVPVIEIENESGDEDGYKLRMEVGLMEDVGKVEKEKKDENTEDEENAVSAREGEFWKKRLATPGVKEKTDAKEVLNRCFPRTYRNLAPHIEFAVGELGLSLAMEHVKGGPKKEDYEQFFGDENAFRGPEIRLQPPKGDWDQVSGYVEVSNIEVQLPIVKGANLKQQLVEAT